MKINPNALQGDRGLRVGIVPAAQGKTDRITKDDRRNLVICPLPYDGSFIETSYLAWEVVIAFLDADALVPREVALPRPAARTVARYLADRREFPSLTSSRRCFRCPSPNFFARMRIQRASCCPAANPM